MLYIRTNTTRLISMHQNKGKSISDCLADRTDYAKNPDKTNSGEYISAYECDPKTVKGEFFFNQANVLRSYRQRASK